MAWPRPRLRCSLTCVRVVLEERKHPGAVVIAVGEADSVASPDQYAVVTSVTFNGIAAAFSVVSATQILARVPADATTGKVQVITPGGTLLSNVGFVVL